MVGGRTDEFAWVWRWDGMQEELAAANQMVQWMTGKWISHAIYAAAKLSIADILQDGEKTLVELAERTSTHAPSLYRLLRALASIGIFRESAPGSFQSTELGDLLRSGAMRAASLMMHSDWHDQAWAQLLHSIRTGESAFEKAHGAPLFDWLSNRPEAGEVFSAAMTAGKAYRDHGIAENYDFASAAYVVDIGGGHGSLMISILERHPHLSGAIADLAQVAEGAKLAIENAGLSKRCQIVACDFFDRVPEGGDVYILAHIMHDWDDCDCHRILESCVRSMKRDGRVLLVESLMSPTNAPDRLKWLDLEMLVLTHGGRERTAEEYRLLLRSAGLDMTGVIVTGGSRVIMEARLGELG
jgi:hypothetical protein